MKSSVQGFVVDKEYSGGKLSVTCCGQSGDIAVTVSRRGCVAHAGLAAGFTLCGGS